MIGAADSYDVGLQPGNQLEEVVVNSLGIKREKQALGCAVSEVNSEALEKRAEGDVGRILAGKASGVQITNQSGISKLKKGACDLSSPLKNTLNTILNRIVNT